jgi:formate hydrogenlyase subunit 3/multisubunit Na+/H+ antiporter MnhD subunit
MLAAISLATALFGNLASLSQTDLKRFLAFVSMAHLGFVSFAISIASEIGLASALFHAFNHATLLMLLFFCLKGFGGLKLGELRIESDFHRFAFLMGGLAASGMPPFNNFLSELLILLAAMERGWFAFSGFLLLNLFLTLLAFLRILKCVMTTKVPGTSLDPSMLPISILIALSLFTGIYPSPLLAWLIEIAKVTI